MHHIDPNQTHGEKARWKLHKNAACCFEQILEAMPRKTATVRPLTSHHTNHPSKMNKHAGHRWRSKHEHVSDVLQRTPTDGRAWIDRPTRIYIHQFCMDAVWRTCQKRWTIGNNDERQSENSLMSALLDEDDDNDDDLIIIFCNQLLLQVTILSKSKLHAVLLFQVISY